MEPMEAALYLRKSRAEEGMETEEVLARHRTELERYAASHQLHIAETYPEVVSGEALCTRPQMLRLLEDVEQDRYGCVLCMDLDRLSRGRMRDQGLILDTLREHATLIVTPDKVYDLSDEQDEEYAELKTFLARREYHIIRKRLRRGLSQSIREGCYCANAPYGYRNMTEDRKPTLAIYEPEARFVRMMFQLYAGGLGCVSIARQVNALGAKPHRSDRFCRNSILHILTCPTYTGKIVWNRSRRKQPQPPDRWTVAEGLHPPIISQDLFDRCQEILARRYRPPHSDGTVRNPLAGLVLCSRCGAHMQMAGRAPQPYLMCPRPGCCAAAQLPLVEQRVLAYLKDTLSAIRLTVPAADPEDETLWKTALRCAKLRITTVQKQRVRLHELLEQEVYDPPTFQMRLEALAAREAEARQQLEEAMDHLNRPCPADPAPETLWQACLGASPAVRNSIYRALVQEIRYTKEKKSKPGEFTLELVLRPL